MMKKKDKIFFLYTTSRPFLLESMTWQEYYSFSFNMCNWASYVYKDRGNIHECFLPSAADPSQNQPDLFSQLEKKNNNLERRVISRAWFKPSHADSDRKPFCVFDAFLAHSIPVFLHIYNYTINASLHLNIRCMCKSIFKFIGWFPQLFRQSLITCSL